jgi:hypothetical protein
MSSTRRKYRPSFISEEVDEALSRAAADQNRSRSNLIESVLTRAMREAGYLKPLRQEAQNDAAA